MIEISVNNEKRQIQEHSTVDQLLELCGFEPRKIAVAINTEFVPRSDYASQSFNAGDAVDILAAVQGG